jgi:enoyl-CoA hydratase/carnithine racemase
VDLVLPGERLQTITAVLSDKVLTVTLSRPEVLNAFNETMLQEFQRLWRAIRDDPAVHVVVLRATGRAFSTGVDRRESIFHSANPLHVTHPGGQLGPKSNECFKPFICAINGMCAGGAFYWVNESDIVICSEDATFFDPHVTYGMTSAMEPVGLARRIPFGEVMRWALMGLDERISAQRALAIGLVSEVTAPADLHARADKIANKIAAKPGITTEGTVRAIWFGSQVGLHEATFLASLYPAMTNPIGRETLAGTFASGARPEWELR